jgi:hypothetical protein
MRTDLWGIVAVMLVSGAVGGLVNGFLTEGGADTPPLAWWKHLIIGIAAAFIVPLFLNMISADLIDKILGGHETPLLVLAGLCLVAAISSRGFIQSITQRLLREVEDVRRKADAAGATAQAAQDSADAASSAADAAATQANAAQELAQAPLTEEPAEGVGDASSRARHRGTPALAADTLDTATQTVLQALVSGPATLRTATGVARDTHLDEAGATARLQQLVQLGLALSVAGSDGQPRWIATAAGRARRHA